MAVVWQLSINHHKTGSAIRGVILADNPFFYKLNRGGFVNMIQVLRSYFVRPVKNKKIELRLPSESIFTSTNGKGEFSVDLEEKIVEVKEVRIDNKVLKNAFKYPTLFEVGSGEFEVVSDIDDTIMISYTADTLRRVTTLLFTSPLERSKVDYAHSLANRLEQLEAKFNYVSKSESNLFGLITAFIRSNGFPKGNIYLTPYLGFMEMLSSKKQTDYKEETINKIITRSDKKFILIGDDTQRDINVYTSVVEKYGGRIFRVYIRQTRNKIKPKTKHFLERLKATGVDVVIFKRDDRFEHLDELKFT